MRFLYTFLMSIATGEIRQRAIDAYLAQKGTQAEVAQFYGTSERTFRRWWREYNSTGRTAPQPRGHNPPALNDEDMRKLDRLLIQTPDVTLEQMRDALGQTCSLTAIHNATRRLNWRYKKKRYEPVNRSVPT